MPADDMCMTPGVVLNEIGQLRQVQMTSVDEVQMTYACGQRSDDIWMSSAHGADDVQMTYVIHR